MALQIIRYMSNDHVIYSQSDTTAPGNSGFPFELRIDDVSADVGRELDIVKAWWAGVECTFSDDDYPEMVFNDFAAFEYHLLTSEPGRLTGKSKKWTDKASKRTKCQEDECVKRGIK